jgi:lipopolysaccharide export LptBFGC system permease protein LptF
MKLIDRYVISSFLKNYLISFLVLIGMYIVLDMIFKLDELAEVNPQASGIEALWSFLTYVADYYFYKIFLYFAYLAGIITVVAACFTLIRMIRFNELSALLSAGVPLLRIATPIILTGLVLNGLLWVDQELVIPRIIPQLNRGLDYGGASDAHWFNITGMRADGNSIVRAVRYFRRTERGPRIEFLDVTERDAAFRPISHLSARSAVWDASKKLWVLEEGVRNRNLDPNQLGTLPLEDVAVWETGVNPEEIELYRSGDFVEWLSTSRINELMKRPLSYGRENLLRVKHSRGIAQITVNMILLLLAISAVLTREPQQLKTAATRAIVLCATCLTVAFLGQELAGQTPPVGIPADKWPALMAWMPIFIFGPLSVILLDRVKT